MKSTNNYLENVTVTAVTLGSILFCSPGMCAVHQGSKLLTPPHTFLFTVYSEFYHRLRLLLSVCQQDNSFGH